MGRGGTSTPGRSRRIPCFIVFGQVRIETVGPRPCLREFGGGHLTMSQEMKVVAELISLS